MRRATRLALVAIALSFIASCAAVEPVEAEDSRPVAQEGPQPSPAPGTAPEPRQAPAAAVSALPPAQRGWIERTDACRQHVGDNRAVGRCMIGRYWSSESEWQCTDRLITRESGWRTEARNRRSSAYGIPQSLAARRDRRPGSKMATHGLDWQTSALTQTSWFADYAKSRYGSPCRALAHARSRRWY